MTLAHHRCVVFEQAAGRFGRPEQPVDLQVDPAASTRGIYGLGSLQRLLK
jgi:hypothetical protein